MLASRFHLDAKIRLEQEPLTEVRLLNKHEPPEGQLKDVEVLVCRSDFKVIRNLLLSAPQLKLIVTVTSGFDHVDLKATHERGIEVRFTPEGNAISAAELTFGLILATVRKLPQAHRNVLERQWNREPLMGTELEGKTLGIVGFGRIGRRVSARAKAFGMRVVACDPYAADEDFINQKTERVSLTELVTQADIITFHVPLTQETLHMGNRALFDELRPGAIVINASRGQVLRERDLVEALQNGQVGACGLDVFENEPLLDSPLLKAPNVVLSPHIGASTQEAFERGSGIAAERVLQYLRTGAAEGGDPRSEPWFHLIP